MTGQSNVPDTGDNGPEPYDGVHVLLLGWEHEDDDLHGNKAMRVGLQRLEDVFRGFFNYTTYSTWRIPIETPTDALNTRLREFRDQHNHRRNLLIIYYAGHGATDANRNLSWLWFNNLQHSPRVEWNVLQTLFLTDCMADVLLVIDCCNALSAVRAARTVNPASATLWAACSADTTTPQSGPTSFTENLIAELEDLGAEGMDVQEINANLVIRMDQIQSLAKILSRNAPHCVPISLARPHGRIRLKRLLRSKDEQLKNPAEPCVSMAEAGSERQERPRRTTDEQRRENNKRLSNVALKSDALGTETPSDDVTEKLKRLEAACLPAQDPLTSDILQMLSDPFANVRLNSISSAAENTYTWIYHNQTFAKWLSDANPLLWIQGKPGSGKSTLMKTIMVNLSHTEHEQPQGPPVVSHFFWAAGTHDQSSFEGFAGHLLHQVIEKAPRAGDYIAKQSITYPREFLVHVRKNLKMIIYHLFYDLESPLFDTPWFFLVDGVDECGTNGTEHDLSMALSLIQDLSKAPSIKVIVASRPEAAIAESFDRAPFLRLQDLTANDIEAYVRTRLRDFPPALDYHSSFGQELEGLVARIVHRAEGVFLWVVLVVRLVRRGMASFDSMADLDRRLERLPPELDGFYLQILDKLRSTSSSRVFSLVFACDIDVIALESEAKVQPLLSTTALYFALNMATTRDVIDARIKVDGPELVRRRADEMSKALQKATEGLIIPEERKGETVSWPEDGNTISYLHKTAYDFLAQYDVRKILWEELPRDDFNPHLALLRAMVMQLKAQDHGIVREYTLDDLSRLGCWSKIEQALRYAEFAINTAPDEAVALLEEMDRVVTYQLTRWSDGSLNHHWSEFLPLGGQCHDDQKSTFLSFVTSCSFRAYLQKQYRDGFITIRKPGRPLLDYAVHPQPQFKGHLENSRTVKWLLKHGADPNEIVAGQTVYYRLLVMSYRYHFTFYQGRYRTASLQMALLGDLWQALEGASKHNNKNLQDNWSRELQEMTSLFRDHGAKLSADQLDALQKEDGIELSKEDVEWVSRQHEG